MEWISLSERAPKEGQKVEFPANKERDGIIKGLFSEGCFWSSFDGYHEPKKWRPDQPERSKREDHESGCGALNTAVMP